MRANKTLRAFAKQHGHRLVTLAFQTERGETVEFEDCVLVQDAGRVAEILNELVRLAEKTDPNPEDRK
jgi:hypothetical protein